MAGRKLVLADVYKKDLKVLGFLILNGGMVLLSMYFETIPLLSVVFGGAVNYIAYRTVQELTNQGYREALKK